MFCVINMDGQHERMLHMANALGAMGLPFERVAAVDGRLLSEQELKAVCPHPGTFRQLVPAEIGCFLSHRKIWQMMLDRNVDRAVVFEDDVIFSYAAADVLNDLEWIPEDADIVRLETWLSHSVVDLNPAVTVAGRGVHRLRTVQYGTAAYIITRKGAEKALKLTEQFVDTADDFLFNPDTPYSKEFITYQMLPAICVQDLRLNRKTAQFESSIERGGRPDRPEGIRLVWREIKRSYKKGVRPVRLFVGNLVGRRRWRLIGFE